jgi:hypothetical protein
VPSIGNIVVKREILHKLLPPVSAPIVKGPSMAVQVAPEIVTSPLSMMPPGGKGGGRIKEVHNAIFQSVAVSDSVTRVKTIGLVGKSFTQARFTTTGYTVLGAAITKSLATETITISEPLAVQRSKSRVLADSDLTEASESTTLQLAKARTLTTETITIGDNVTTQTPIFRDLIETETISDGVVVAVKESKRTLVENDALDDNVAITLPGIRMTLVEDVPILEDLDFEVTHPGGVNITKSLGDTTTIGEANARVVANKRTLATETVTISEDVIKTVRIQTTSFTDSFTTTSYAIYFESRVEKSLEELTEESHTVRMVLTKARGLSDTVTIIG